jgi:putative addiction module component (TIGR02574 family)
MMATLGIDKLTREEQSQLLHELQQKFEPDEPTVGVLTDAQKAVLRRRAALADADPESGQPWDKVYAATLARLGR